ncbi:amino acid ABC transporter membrane protein 2 (PAAT family) [Breoghania corrubedonensis]|uniref:Amino acid ABC transporter membrane protein 2 (PAAT family) n=1 Tax=Breoghania corrubedonensis TaxID=665038 RepID=A0A2T5V1B7_9HYPH|nr:ABC transporter permease [Breoghania corrubedonensis]PTW57554.1 amino acid ABC transporter membrane protein 2 (PAAT family) [Breoghania corrubedonensis]
MSLGSAAAEAPPAPVKTARPWTFTRIAGYALMGFWIAMGLGLVAFLVSSFDPEFMAKYGAKFIKGLIVTIELVGLSVVLGALVSLPVAMGRLSSNKIIGRIAYSYVYFFRGTPLLAQVFLFYYGAGSFRPFLQDIGLWWLLRDAWGCALLTFTLNTSAYQAEILAGAIRNVPAGQIEAGKTLGLKRGVIFFRIVLPQALITALRPYGNEVILMLKGSAIVSIVTVFDLMGETRRIYSRTYDFQAYLWAAMLYIILVEGLRRVWDKLEARLTRHLKR